jgi:molybdate transport system regulatory protein
MKTSARNQFSGTIKALTKGPVSTEVIIEVVSGMRIVATISTVSAESLGLAVGKRAYALVKASSVVVAID